MSKDIYVKELGRYPQQSDDDVLYFKTGINVIVGPPNSGKTKWLQTLDYLLGSSHKANEILDNIYDKYEEAKAVLNVTGEDFVIKRNWRDTRVETKVFVNEEMMTLPKFWLFLLDKLDIPLIHYPKGNPYGPTAWPELNWRSLYRHIYRRQKYWSDLADRQPEGEQHACLLQFLGYAIDIFPDERNQLVQKEKDVEKLELQREQFLSLLHDLSFEITQMKEIGVALTPQSLEEAFNITKNELSDILESKRSIVEDIEDLVDNMNESNSTSIMKELFDEFESYIKQKELLEKDIIETEKRIKELMDYKQKVVDEINKIERAKVSGSILSGIKVTHCPACDQEIKANLRNNSCYVCNQVLPASDVCSNNTEYRLAFEEEQLKGELLEIDELVKSSIKDIKNLKNSNSVIDLKIGETQFKLSSFKSRLSFFIPPEISILDFKAGRISEKLKQLNRVRMIFEKREEISTKINLIQQEIQELKVQNEAKSKRINLYEKSSKFEDSINTYLNKINKVKENVWTQGRVNFKLTERDFQFFVGGQDWVHRLGGNLTLYFLFAYHYALMCLSRSCDSNYPGLIVIDYPAEVEGVSIADKENFTLEPFIDLLGQEGMENTQLIAAGSSFENLRSSNRIQLSRVW